MQKSSSSRRVKMRVMFVPCVESMSGLYQAFIPESSEGLLEAHPDFEVHRLERVLFRIAKLINVVGEIVACIVSIIL